MDEREQMNRLLGYLEQEFSSRQEDCTVIIEPSIPSTYGGDKPDALVIKDNMFVLLELKDYYGDIVADCSPKGMWHTKEGRVVQSPGQRNPFSQAWDHSDTLLDFLGERLLKDGSTPAWAKRDLFSFGKEVQKHILSWVVTGEGSYPSIAGRDPQRIPWFKVYPVEKVSDALALVRSQRPLYPASSANQVLSALSASPTTRSEWFRGAQIESEEKFLGMNPKISSWIDSGSYSEVQKSLGYIRELELRPHLPQLTRIWRESREPAFRRTALEIMIEWQIGKLGQYLDEALRDSDQSIVNFALEFLSKFRYDEPVGTLSAMLGGNLSSIQLNVLKALVRSGGEEACSTVLTFAERNFYDRPFKDYQHWRDRYEKMADEAINRSKYEEVVQLERRRTLVYDLCHTTIDSLAELGCKSAVPWLKQILEKPTSLGFESDDYNELASLHSDYWGVFASSCRSLARLGSGDPGATDVLLKRLDHSPEDYQEVALRAIGGLGDRRAIPVLLTFVFGSEFYLRQIAVSSLGEMRANEAYPQLEQLYLQTIGKDGYEEEQLNRLLEQALLEIDRLAFEKTILSILNSRSIREKRSELVRELLWKLHPIVTAKSTRFLLGVLDEKGIPEEFREEAAIMLSKLNNEEAQRKGHELEAASDPRLRSLGLTILYPYFRSNVAALGPFEGDPSPDVREIVASCYLEFGEFPKLLEFKDDKDEGVRKIVYYGLRRRSKAEVSNCQFVSASGGSSAAEILVSDYGLGVKTKDKLQLIPYDSIARLAEIHYQSHAVAIYFETKENGVGHGLVVIVLYDFDGYELFRDYEVAVLFKLLGEKSGLDPGHCRGLGNEELGYVRGILEDERPRIGKTPMSLEELS